MWETERLLPTLLCRGAANVRPMLLVNEDLVRNTLTMPFQRNEMVATLEIVDGSSIIARSYISHERDVCSDEEEACQA